MKKTQKSIIADKLKADGEVSNLWAITNNIWRLGAVIKNLRDSGWEISGDYIPGTKVWNYKLLSAPKRTIYTYALIQGVRIPQAREIYA
mgnify:CR=1 FL=1